MPRAIRHCSAVPANFDAIAISLTTAGIGGASALVSSLRSILLPVRMKKDRVSSAGSGAVGCSRASRCLVCTAIMWARKDDDRGRV